MCIRSYIHIDILSYNSKIMFNKTVLFWRMVRCPIPYIARNYDAAQKTRIRVIFAMATR